MVLRLKFIAFFFAVFIIFANFAPETGKIRSAFNRFLTSFLILKTKAMKKLLLLLLLFVVTATYADDARIVIKQKSGNETVLKLATNLVITFEGEDMVITNDFTTISIPLVDISDYEVSNGTPTGVEPITDQPRYASGHVIFTGMTKGTSVYVHTFDGKMVGKQTVGASGKVDVSLKSLPEGTYIISTQKNKIKVINK